MSKVESKVEVPQSPELREAIDELQLYLSDTLPPLVVADSIKLLLDYPPKLVAFNIHSWTTGQYQRGSQIPVSDYLFHAVKKIQLLGEFRLVPQEPFVKYLEGLKAEILAYCPEGDREFLKSNLDHLSDAATGTTSPVEVVFRQKAGGGERGLASGGPAGASAGAGAAAGAAGVAAVSASDLGGLRRVEILLDRLERELQHSADPQAALRQAPLAAQALAAAARSSKNPEELDQMLDRLRSLGVDVNTADVLRSLGNSLPGWVQPVTGDPLAGAGAPAPSPTLEAMRRMVTEAQNPVEGARRFSEMVKAAIERFNEGSLPQAITMLELAERIIAERRVDAVSADVVRHKADEGIDVERLRKYAEAVDQHTNLRRVLNFFVNLTTDGLFASLRKELKRERRRLLLLLLEVHGPAARQAALERLHEPFGRGAGDEDWYFRRNMLYLLRRIPRPPDAPLEQDVDVAVRHSELTLPAPLVKEAIANLGQLKHERAEQSLIVMLQDVEGMLTKPGESPLDPRELRLLLDRLVAALARYGTPNSRRAVVDHALSGKKEFGETLPRLAELSGQDFSGEGDIVEKLLATMKSNTPFKLFGLVLHQNDRNLQYCIEALSATRITAVQQALQEIVRRFPGQEVAKAAEKALAAADSPIPPPQPASAPEGAGSMTGDLDLFGLPSLMQSLSDSGVSGSLTLRDPKGEMFASLTLRTGKLSQCQTGRLSAEEAFYQLLERPCPGNFLFVRQSESASDKSGMMREVMPLTLEAMRRYDEFQQAAALVPDNAVLKTTDVKPSPHPQEKDGILVNDLWTKVSTSATPLQCEAELKADSYRIRRLLAYWVEQGALSIGELPATASK